MQQQGSTMEVGNGGKERFCVSMDMHRQSREKLVRRLQAAGASPKRILLMEGGKAEYRHETDTEKVFRQESSFHYLFGVREPGFYGVIEVATGATSLYMPRLPQEYAVWMGAISPPEHFKAFYQVDRVLYDDELVEDLKSMAPDLIYLNQGVNTDSGSIAKPASVEGLVGVKTDLSVLYRELAECRVIKSAGEVRLLQYVNDISSDAHVEVMKRVRPGMHEYQLESLFLHHVYYHGGCRHSAYTSICGCGPDSAVLHYGHAGAPNDRMIGPEEMLLLDMGGEHHCYASDITCSFPASGKFTEDQRMIFEAVQAMQFAVMDALKPGVAWKDMHELAYRTGAEKLKAGGLLQGDVDAMMDANLMSIFMPHGLGHMMGIDVHDVGGYPEGQERDTRPGFKSLRTTRVLRAGMVITVEPGIYFIGILLDKALQDPKLAPFIVAHVLQRFRQFGGVRLEDDVVITDEGCHNMTNCPRTVEDVEAVMSGRITHRSQLFKKC